MNIGLLPNALFSKINAKRHIHFYESLTFKSSYSSSKFLYSCGFKTMIMNIYVLYLDFIEHLIWE